MFGIVNALGALAGPALLGSHSDWIQAAGGTTLSAMSETLRLAAGIASLTTIYLAILLTTRIRRRLAELRGHHAARPTSQPGALGTPTAPSINSRWRPPRPSNALAVAFTAIAFFGVALVLAAWYLPTLCTVDVLRPLG